MERMRQPDIFDNETVVPDPTLTQRAGTLLGFETRYTRVRDQLRLLLPPDELGDWSRGHHRRQTADHPPPRRPDYPLVVFPTATVGTGKTAMAECIANRLMVESRTEDLMLFPASPIVFAAAGLWSGRWARCSPRRSSESSRPPESTAARC